MSWILREITKDDVGPPITLQTKDNVIGRKVGTFIKLVSSFASRQHCTIKIKNEEAYIIDHNTLNGTFIGPDKIPTNREIPLQNGDCIGIGLAATEFSPEPYFQIFKMDVNPEITEIPDTCEATMLYIPEKQMPCRTNEKDVFLVPPSLFRQSLNRYPSLPGIKCEKTSLSVTEDSSGDRNRIPSVFIDKSNGTLVKAEVGKNSSAQSRNIVKQERLSKVSNVVEREGSERTEHITACESPGSPEEEIIEIDLTETDVEPLVERNSMGNIANPAGLVVQINEQSNQNQNVQLSQRITNQTKSNSSVHEFSICDNDIIVIDDDEDEDDLPCSQFFTSSRKDSVPVIEEESLSSFRSEMDEDMIENLDEELNIIDDDRLSVDNDVDSSNVACGNKCVSNKSSTNSLPLIHSQLSPETYLTRVNNENNMNTEMNSNSSISNEADLLGALMTQKDNENNKNNENDNTSNLSDIFADVENWLSEVDVSSDMESHLSTENKKKVSNLKNESTTNLNVTISEDIITEDDDVQVIVIEDNNIQVSSIEESKTYSSTSLSKKSSRKSLTLRRDADKLSKTTLKSLSCKNIPHKSTENVTTNTSKDKSTYNSVLVDKLPSKLISSDQQTSCKRRNLSKNDSEPLIKSSRLSKDIQKESLITNKNDSSSSERRNGALPSESIESIDSRKNKDNLLANNKHSTSKSKIKHIKDAGKLLEQCMKRFKKSPKKKANKEPYNLRPSEKRKILEKRREKLKEVAEKEKDHRSTSKPDKIVPNETETVSNEYVKNTEKNRGAILIEMIPQQSSSKRKRIVSNEKSEKQTATEHKTSEDVISVRRSSRKSVLEKEKLRCKFDDLKKRRDQNGKSDGSSKELLSSHCNKENLRKPNDLQNTNSTSTTARRKSSLKSRDSTGSPKNVQFAAENRLTTVKYYDKDPIDVNKFSNMDISERKSLIPSKGSPLSNDEIIYLFCKWNPIWIQESLNLSTLPPLLEGSFPHPSPTVEIYQNYSDYQNAMLPLQVFEVWETLLRDVLQQNSDPFIGVVREVHGKGVSNPKDIRKMDIISVTGFVTCTKVVPQRGDFVIVRGVNSNPQSMPNSSNNKAMWLSFGYISCQPIKKPIQHSDKSSMESFQRLRRKHNGTKGESGQVFTVNFKVMVRQKITKFWKIDQEISVIVCSNIIGDMKLFSTLAKLYYSPLVPLILNPSSFQPIDKGDEFTFKQQQSLNKEQMRAVDYCSEMILGNNSSIALIHGPPGTGKSVVITHILMTVLDQVKKDKQKKRLLLCAPSNFAVDQLVTRLLNIRKKMTKNKFNMVRVGKYDMMSEDGKNVSLKTLSEKMLKTFSNPVTAKQEIDRLGKREKYLLSLQDCRSEKIAMEINANRRYTRELQLLSQNKADQMLKTNMLKRFEKELLINADIVATTLSSSVSLPVMEALSKRDSSPFGCCIIDEATQATELQTLIPILLDVNKFVLVGDHKQLSPVITNQKAKADGLEVSLFERLLTSWEDKCAPIFPLVRQYRMHREIAQFPNKTFYSGKLTTERPHHKSPLKPYLVFNHCFNQSNNKDMNIDEGNMVIKLIENISNSEELKGMSKAIITPYQAQREFLKNRIKSRTALSDVSIMTVDSAQGQERDIIILSCVKTNSVGFLGDANRLNVALTRAKHCLLIVANFKTLQEHQLWHNLLVDAKNRRVLIDISSLPSESSLKRYIYCDK